MLLIIYGNDNDKKISHIKSLINSQSSSLSACEINGFDKKPLDKIKNIILSYCLSYNSNMGYVIIHNIDYMSKDIQYYLRFIIEHHIHVGFIFTCENINKIIDPIKSRCLMKCFVLSSAIYSPITCNVSIDITDVFSATNLIITKSYNIDHIMNYIIYNDSHSSYECDYITILSIFDHRIKNGCSLYIQLLYLLSKINKFIKYIII